MAFRSHPLTSQCHAVLARVSPSYPPLKGKFLRVTHPSATRHPRSKLLCAAVRLACVRHAASVQSEPGSNSSLKLSVRQSRPIFPKGSSQRKTSLLTDFMLDPCIIWTVSSSTARRPHKSPAHTVKDQSLAILSSDRPETFRPG